MNDLCIDIGYNSLNKYNEQLCGDQVMIEQFDDGNSVVVVLADGLGSGVKANILATLTAKILSTMMAHSIDINDCISTVVASLPVCKVRGIAYSTFTIVRLWKNMTAEIIQYDNPHVILLRNGSNYKYPQTLMEIEGKTIFFSRVRLQKDDALILISDGVVHTGIDGIIDLKWQRDQVVDYMEHVYDRSLTAKTLATLLLDECSRRYHNKPMDDTTVCALKIRKRQQVNLMIGPPLNREDDNKMMSLFFSKEGKSIICGGTTANIAARYLGRKLETSLDYVVSEIPPTSEIQGVDLVTEGVLTVNKVLTYAQDYLGENAYYYKWCYQKDGASRIAKMLFEEATDINFYVGQAVNPAHQDPELPINFSIKMSLVNELSKCLKKMGKRIKVSYF